MAGMLQTVMVNFTPAVSKTAHFQSKFWSPCLVSSKCCFGSAISNKSSLVPWKHNSVSKTLINRNRSMNNDSHHFPLQYSVVPNFLVYAEPLLKFAGNNFLPLALIGGIAFALTNPGPGCLAHRYQLSKFSIIWIFFITGLTLPSEEIGEAVKAWPVGLFGLTSILLLTPLFSRIMVQFHLQPQEFVTGLALYNCMPTAISSGVALTRLAGGNSALALSMTVLSSLLGILIVPFSVSKLVAGGVGASVPAGEMFRSLIVTLLIPLILGKVFRDSSKGIADIVDNNRKFLSSLGAILISLIPWMEVSKSKPLLLMVKPGVVLIAVIMGVLLHLVLLCFNAFSIRVLCAVSGGNKSIFAKKQNSNTLLLVASQKTVSVLVAVVEQLGGTFGEAGLLILPCIAAHISQVIIDSLIVSFWNKRKHSLTHVKIT